METSVSPCARAGAAREALDALALMRSAGLPLNPFALASALTACRGNADGRGLHWSTFQLNLSALYGIGGARRGGVARVKGMFRLCRVLSCDRHGPS